MDPMTDPWDERYIYLHGCLIFMVNVGNIPYMDPVDYGPQYNKLLFFFLSREGLHIIS